MAIFYRILDIVIIYKCIADQNVYNLLLFHISITLPSFQVLIN
jgi:hypothetical protein